MSQIFNPITRTISRCVPLTNPDSLHSLCRKVILQAITLRRISQADELLPLPKALVRTISCLNLNDFVIDAENLEPGNHEKQTYPAKCLLDGKPCIIKVMPKGSDPELENPSFIVSFEESNTICFVYEKTDTLRDCIEQCKARNTQLQDIFIWHVTKGLLEFILKGHVTTSTKINSSLIHIGSNGEIFLEIDDSQMTKMDMGPDSAIYEAPEVLRREEPTNQSFSWTTGCIIYEMLALEPAFYDRTGTNPFQVFMDMMQGVLPPEPPVGSADMKSLMWSCLKSNPADRVAPEEILNIASRHLSSV